MWRNLMVVEKEHVSYGPAQLKMVNMVTQG